VGLDLKRSLGLKLGAGAQQWIWQRSANLLTVVFVGVLFGVLAAGLSYESLVAMLGQTGWRTYLVLTLIFAGGNSVLAGWQIAGDYARKAHLPVWLPTGLVAAITLLYLVAALRLIYGVPA